jgi:protein-disulfide isomerase
MEKGVRSTRQSVLVALLAISLAGGGLTLVIPPVPAGAEPVSTSEFRTLREDLERMKADLQELKKELMLIRQVLSRSAAQPPPPAHAAARVSIAGNPALGKKEAPITVVEFSDYQCPFCKRFFENTLPTLKAEYIDAGKVRYVFRDFPLDRIHPQARKAAEAAHCAGDQGKYWEMHDLLFRNQQALHVESLKLYARNLELDIAVFDACLDRGTYGAEVQRDLEDGLKAGIRGTPGFYVGKTRHDETVEGILISGAHPIDVFRQAIEGLLRDN